MTADLNIQCSCGQVRGVAKNVEKGQANYLRCYCADCQAFAVLLGQEALLDSYRGTSLIQLPLSRVEISQGLEQLACMRLSAKGLHRWYASCCNTPFGNTAGPGLAFVGLVETIFSTSASSSELEQRLGKSVGVLGHGGANVPPEVAARGMPIGFVFKVAAKLIGWRLRGLASPSVYFDQNGQPRIQPQVVEPSRAAAAYKAVASSCGRAASSTAST